MNSEIKAVVFDMDGVIFDTERVYQKCWISEGGQFGAPDVDELFSKMMGASMLETEKIFLNKYGKDFPFWDYRAKVKAKISEMLENGSLILKKGVKEILTFLNENSIPTALATSTKRESVENYLNKTGIKEHFNYIVTGDEVLHGKPDPEIYLKACGGLGVNPEFAIAIEDSFNGIRSAYRAGMMPVMIPDTVLPDDEITAVLYKKFESLLDVIDFLSA